MVFKVSLYVSLLIFGFGFTYKISNWFRYNYSYSSEGFRPSTRLFKAIKGILFSLFSPKLITLVKVFALDIICQRRIWQRSRLRWSMHMCIFGGFMLLLFMHAFENFLAVKLFPDYSSTLNPFLFLRNFFGLVVIIGLILSVYRRHILKIPRLMTNAMDHYTIIILAIIMISGFLLEGVKITSYRSYQGMVEDYSDADDEESLNALENYWVRYFGLVSPRVKGPFDKDILAQGEELHEVSCSSCHSRPQWAFISYGLSKPIRPVAVLFDKLAIQNLLWHIHFLACFLGLAYFPFSRMFHVFASPISLLANSVMSNSNSDKSNIITKQMMELDACTHCGTCSLHCKVGVSFEEIQNVNILPSEKLGSVKKLFTGKSLERDEITSMQEGLYLCSNCYQCTLVCPAGINLQDLWFNVREELLARGYPELLTFSTFSYYRGLKRAEIKQEHYAKQFENTLNAIARECNSYNGDRPVLDLRERNTSFLNNLTNSIQEVNFSSCFTCMTCSNECPVVSNFNGSGHTLGLIPHQIIHAAILGLPDMIYRARMLWSCLGCYKCQEACPQGVRVTDILYELKNLAVGRMKEKTVNRSAGEL